MSKENQYIKLFAQQAMPSDYEDAVEDMRVSAKVMADLLSAATCVEGEYEPPAHFVSQIAYCISSMMDFAEAIDRASLLECNQCETNLRKAIFCEVNLQKDIS
ncbi:MAG: hypothetical protein LC541_18255 [Candidatus Thiodiazotropha sp.]|nr:hypothetical protein [Candidatus Thiodiazotropha sp.]MCM8885213.1 hypothetical protein [Candidatus Thiodiazotropha sp.]MCM8921001.1 hypothetical protein [Candidatus Thiodiazotropha sp.]